MQKFLFLAASLSLMHAALGQVKEGKIIYQRKVDMYRHLEDENAKSMLPQFNTSKTELDFSADESIYKNLKQEEDIRDKAGEDNNGRVMIKLDGGDDQTYKNINSGKMIQLKELGPKKYIIEDTLPRQNWKLLEGIRIIKGYTCKKATTTNRQGMGIIAWYTEDIQASVGPEFFGGLPGLILELNINDDEIAFTTLDIITAAFDKKIVKAPTEGKQISASEYHKMMEDQFGAKPGGGMSIRIIHN
jgi:GLPGLI family protein